MEFQSFLKFDELDKESLTPMFREYYDIKAEYKDFILLYRIGEFFETYFEDALLFSNITGASLTRRKVKSGKIHMSGIPRKKLDIYVEKLINSDCKVAIAEQIFDGEKYSRKIVKTYTKGTLFDLELLNSKENNYLACLVKKDGLYEICYSDISVGAVYLSLGNKEEIKCELARISPSELLIPVDNKIEEEIYSPYKYEFLKEKFYDLNHENPSYFGLLNYVKYILKSYTPEFEKVQIYKIEKNLLMDFTVRKNLELTKNSYNNKKYGSVLWALDYCKTPMGKRLLSSFISTPLVDLETIRKRQGVVSKYLQNPDNADNLGVILEDIGDILRLSSRLSNESITPLEFLTLKYALKKLNEIEKIKKSFKAELLEEIQIDDGLLSDYFEILDKTVEDDIEKIKSGDFIKRGADSNLDVLYLELDKAFCEVEEYEGKLRAYTNIQALKIKCGIDRFLIEIPSLSINPRGADFRLVQKLKSITKYTTDELLALEERIFSLQKRIDEKKKNIFLNLKKYSKEMTEGIRAYSRALALLDVFYSMYCAAKEYNLVCPEIESKGEFVIKEAAHICAKKILGEYDSLDIDFSDSNFVMLTGQNGIGKSTYLKQIGILIIMAQTGSFIPCKTAEIPLIDRLFTVLNIGDELINKKSMHQNQMKEISRITKNLTDRSVVLLDEIGKSTSYTEGISISYGLIKYFIEETKAKTVFATHYPKLEELLKDSCDKISYRKISIENGKRHLTKGVSQKSFGIETAQEENLPEKIINYAKQASQLI